MSHTPIHSCGCAAIAVIASLAVSDTPAGSLVRAAYRVRVLALEAPFVTGFNDHQQVIGYGPQDPLNAGFLWDAKHGLQFIDPSGMVADNSAGAIPLDINQHGEVAGLRRIGPGSAHAFVRDRSGTVLDLGPSLPMVSMIVGKCQAVDRAPLLGGLATHSQDMHELQTVADWNPTAVRG